MRAPCLWASSAARSAEPSWKSWRDAAEPMTVRDIATALMQQSGKELDGREFNLVVARVRNAVPRMADQLDGELRGRATYWSIKNRVT